MSQIPVRRSTRTTSNAYKSSQPSSATNPENAHARAGRTRSSAKQTQTTIAVKKSRTVAKSVDADPAEPSKKPPSKRPGLKDVTRIMANKERAKKSGKEDGKPSSKPASKTTTKRVTRSTVVTVLKEVVEESEEHVMHVDPPVRDAHRLQSPPRLAKRPSLDDGDLEERATKKHKTEAAEDSYLEAEHVADVLAGPCSDDVAQVAEHDPDGDQWVDIDADDADDPAMVSEYVADTFNWLRETEMDAMPEANYMTKQSNIDWDNRAELVDWIMQIHIHCRLFPETLFLTINLLDRFLCLRPVSISKLQLVGVAAFLIASKFEETYAPSVPELVTLTDGMYTTNDILKAERFLLKTLEWNLSGYANVMGFLRRCSKADDSETAARTIGKYLCEIACMEWKLLAVRPSLLAAASIWLSRLILGREEWTANLAHYSGYRESEVIGVANTMLNYILKPVRHETLYKKYATKRFLKVSVSVRKWALEHWEVNTIVDLAAELPRLKAEIKAENDRKKSEEDLVFL